MRHDKRDKMSGQWREVSAREKAYGTYVRKTGEPPKRQPLNVTCFDAPLFVDKHVNREPYNPFGKDDY
jgi:hypothetical protein